MGRLVNPFKYILNKYFFVTPLFYSYGNAAEEIMWAYAKASLMKRKLIVIAPAKYTQILGFTICNSELFNLEFGCKLNIFEVLMKSFISFIVNLIFFFMRLLALTLKKFFQITLHERYFFPQIGRYLFWPALYINSENFKQYQEDLILKEFLTLPSPTVNLNKKYQEKVLFDKLMNQVNFKYVCLHVRDSGFHKDSNRRPYRNADINCYIPTIKMLIKEGFTVIRVGDKSMKKCNFTDDNFIESYHLESKSELSDLLLIQNCEFFIGMQSGPFDLALLFQKPVLLVNMYTWFFGSPMKSFDRGLLKKMLIKGIGEVDSLSKRLALPYKYTDSVEELPEHEVTFIENSPAEILEATKQFYSDYLSDFKQAPSKALASNRSLYKLSSDNILKNFLAPNKINRPDESEINRIIYRELSSLGIFYCNSNLKQ